MGIKQAETAILVPNFVQNGVIMPIKNDPIVQNGVITPIKNDLIVQNGIIRPIK